MNKRKRAEREVPSSENTKVSIFKPNLLWFAPSASLYAYSFLTLFLRVCQLIFRLELSESIGMRNTILLQYLLPMYNLPSAVPQYYKRENERKITITEKHVKKRSTN